MYAGTCPSEASALVPGYIRARGGVTARFAVGHRGTRIADLSERGGFRFRFPEKHDETCEAVLINTGGGMTGGDALTLDIEADEHARASVTTQAAEKIYRSQGPDTLLRTSLRLASGSALAWLPQETILFSGARVRRELAIAMPASAHLLAVESVVFGRAAMGETLGQGSFRDRWRVRRDGNLIFAEDIRLDGDMGETLKRKAVAAGARAAATVLLVSPDAEERLEPCRHMLAAMDSECAAANWNGMLLVRFLAKDAAMLRRDLATCLSHLSGASLPRVWQC
ncbi:MAG: urease accessory protein UreD [Beijerinckiaceae bacterium]|nr:urease accessory protein UreD [Beijerinckiaceae bacterium]